MPSPAPVLPRTPPLSVLNRTLRRSAAPEFVLGFSASPAVPAEEPIAMSPRRGRLARSGAAFALELREESIRFADTNPWAQPPDALLEDDNVLDGRERAARRVLGHAAEAGLDMALRGAFDRHAEARVEGRGKYSGIRLDLTPSWTIRRRTADGVTLRLDVPLTPDSLRFHCSRELANDRGVQRIGGGISIDPFDESLRIAITLGF